MKEPKSYPVFLEPDGNYYPLPANPMRVSLAQMCGMKSPITLEQLLEYLKKTTDSEKPLK